jgi:hypothetical protein
MAVFKTQVAFQVGSCGPYEGRDIRRICMFSHPFYKAHDFLLGFRYDLVRL